MSTPINHWNQNFIEDEESGLLCSEHSRSVCTDCPFDYSLLEERFADESNDIECPHSDEMTEGESLLIEDELKKYKAALVVMKGCVCHFPFMGSGCKKCNMELAQTKTQVRQERRSNRKATKSKK